MWRTLIGGLAVVIALTGSVAAQVLKPAEIVAELYGADEEPDPAFSARLQGLFDADAARTPEGEVGALDFDWITGGQDIPDLTELTIATTAETAAAATVTASFKNYGEARFRVFSFIAEGGQWVIDDVDLQEPEKTRLSTILSRP